jgi:hypothetical protein
MGIIPKQKIAEQSRRKDMKILTLVLSVLMATSAFGMYAPSKKHCGTIYKGANGVHIQVTMDDTPGDGKADVFDYEIASTNRETVIALNRVGKRDKFIGCVHSKKFPVQGFEGKVILASKVELMGMID